jgi:hypothetical protein
MGGKCVENPTAILGKWMSSCAHPSSAALKSADMKTPGTDAAAGAGASSPGTGAAPPKNRRFSYRRRQQKDLATAYRAVK